MKIREKEKWNSVIEILLIFADQQNGENKLAFYIENLKLEF